MKINVSEIVEGFRNDMFPPKKLKALIEQTAVERLSICLNCPFNSSCGKITRMSRCKDCGCFLTKKAKCLSCSCPQGKWGAVVTEEVETKIDKALENDNSTQHPDI